MLDETDNDKIFHTEGEIGVLSVCGEFGKDQEFWYLCIVCGQSVHAMCSDKGVPDSYYCGFC